ncbi:hypothetical protein [Pedobacter frigoris]|uniref:Uncharacterized protein n=1 Tax=Pedobacter frigoris TaxID=2571272 RepID=A0A4U1CJI4_9SPHI|nr:hypothetical protein [Pedobacter frigoris]TKC06962.1 hypothetical protein FA047_06735 [Pedobacter frigoris]
MKQLHSITFAFLIFLSLIAIRTSAQTDYVISNDGTKTMGEVKKYNVKSLKFVPAGQKKAVKYNPEQVNEFYKAGDGTFRSIALNTNNRPFLHVLEDGKIKLYEYLVNGQTGPTFNGTGGFMSPGYSYSKQRWYAQKNGGDLVEVKSNGIWGSRKDRKNAFSDLISDNEHVLQRYKNEDKFTFDFVRSLVVEYNGK